MILNNAKFLTNHNLKGSYTRNFRANMYEFIHIKTMVTLSGQGEGRERPVEAYNNLAQEFGNKNTDEKTSLKFDKELKEILKKTTTIDSEKPESLLEEESTKIKTNGGLENPIINTKGLFKYAVSATKLKEAWYQLKSHPDMLTKESGNETINNVNDSWFENTSKTLINGTFKYPAARRVHIPKPASKTSTRLLSITNPRIKIIEKTLLNHLEVIFEGAYTWNTILETEFRNAETNLKTAILKSEYKIIADKETKK